MSSIAVLLIGVLNLYNIILLIRALISWFPIDPYNPFVRFIYSITEPVLEPIRRVLPATGGFDFSILAAFFLIMVLEQLLRSFL